MNRLLLATALTSFGLITALAGRAAGAANLVQDGNFSQTTGALSTTTSSGGEIDANYSDNGDVADWSSPNTAPYGGAYNLYFFGLANDKTTNADARFTEAGQYLNSNFTGNSPAGGGFMALDGDPGFSGPLEQTINGLTVGQTYQLSFYWAGGELADRTNFDTVQLTGSFGSSTFSTPVYTNTNTTPGDAGLFLGVDSGDVRLHRHAGQRDAIVPGGGNARGQPTAFRPAGRRLPHRRSRAVNLGDDAGRFLRARICGLSPPTDPHRDRIRARSPYEGFWTGAEWIPPRSFVIPG